MTPFRVRRRLLSFPCLMMVGEKLNSKLCTRDTGGMPCAKAEFHLLSSNSGKSDFTGVMSLKLCRRQVNTCICT